MWSWSRATAGKAARTAATKPNAKTDTRFIAAPVRLARCNGRTLFLLCYTNMTRIYGGRIRRDPHILRLVHRRQGHRLAGDRLLLRRLQGDQTLVGEVAFLAHARSLTYSAMNSRMPGITPTCAFFT